MFRLIIPAGTRAEMFQISRDVSRMGEAFQDLKEPLTDAVNKVILPSIARNFQVGGRPKWAPLADATLSHPDRSSGPILVDTGNLREIATSERPWRITKKEADMSKLISMVTYAQYHQTGTRDMPQRMFALFQERDARDIEEIFARWVDKIARTRGRWP